MRQGSGSEVILEQSPIFVVGAPRSGTTLVAWILERHPEVFRVGESHFFVDVYKLGSGTGQIRDAEEFSLAVDRLMGLLGRHYNPDTQDLVDRGVTKEDLIDRAREMGGSYGSLYYALMNMLAESAGKVRFCDDTPRHAFYLDTIMAMFPQAKVVGCVRDPRDNLGSLKHVWRRGAPGDRERMRVGFHPVLRSLALYSYLNRLLEHSGQEDEKWLTLIRYEDLVTNPEDVVLRLCGFLELNYLSDLLRIDKHNSSFERSRNGIFSSSVGRWRTSLTPEEAWWAQRLNRRHMLMLGYGVEEIHVGKADLFAGLSTAPLSLGWSLATYPRHQARLAGLAWRRLGALMPKQWRVP